MSNAFIFLSWLFCSISILTVFRPAWKKGLYTESYNRHVALCAGSANGTPGVGEKAGFISFFQRWWDKWNISQLQNHTNLINHFTPLSSSLEKFSQQPRAFELCMYHQYWCSFFYTVSLSTKFEAEATPKAIPPNNFVL